MNYRTNELSHIRAITTSSVFVVLLALLVLLAALVAIGLLAPAGAGAVKYGKLDKRGSIPAYASNGSQIPLSYKWKKGPLAVVATLPNGYMGNVLTKVVVKYTYRNAKLSFASGRKSTYRKWFGKHKLGSQKVTLNIRWPMLPNGPSISRITRLKATKMNHTRTVVFWVNLPCMQPVDYSQLNGLYSVTPTNWVCWPPALSIEFEGFVRRTRPKSFAAVSHKLSQLGIFVYPQQPVSPTEPTPSTPQPSEPTGPTGPSGPTGYPSGQ